MEESQGHYEAEQQLIESAEREWAFDSLETKQRNCLVKGQWRDRKGHVTKFASMDEDRLLKLQEWLGSGSCPFSMDTRLHALSATRWALLRLTSLQM